MNTLFSPSTSSPDDGSTPQQQQQHQQGPDLEAGQPSSEASRGNGARGWLGALGAPFRQPERHASASAAVVDAAPPGRAAFDTEIAAVEADLGEVQTVLQQLKKNLANAKLEVQAQQAKARREEMERDVARLMGMCRRVNERLKAIQGMNNDQKKVPGCEAGSADARHRQAVTMAMVNRMKEQVKELQAFRDEANAESRSSVKRQLQMVTGKEPSPEEVDAIVDAGRGEDVMRIAMERVGKQGEEEQLRAAIEEISERQGVVSDLTKSLKELNDMVVSMAFMVESQGELLNTVEGNVGDALADTQKGTVSLKKAREHQISMRKWMCIGGCVVAGIILAIIIWVAIYIQMNNQKNNSGQ